MNSQFCGVKIIGSGSAVPEGVLTNKDLEALCDTSDEWIYQRTGVRQRHICKPENGEGTTWLCTQALQRAVDDAGIKPNELDLIIVATVSGEMACPSTACRVANNLGAAPAGAFDLLAACSGFVYGLNLAESLIRLGRYRTIGVVGCDVMSSLLDYSNRKVCILFGDAAGAVVLRRHADPSVGCLYQEMHADGSRWADLYLPRSERDVPPGADWNEVKLNRLQMNGREVYKFAVTTFQETLERALQANHLTVGDVDMLIAHQSNARIIESTMRKLNLPEEKVYINIENYGNSSGGSVPLCFDEVRRAGRIGDGDIVILVAFGAGMTWASSVWRL